MCNYLQFCYFFCIQTTLGPRLNKKSLYLNSSKLDKVNMETKKYQKEHYVVLGKTF